MLMVFVFAGETFIPEEADKFDVALATLKTNWVAYSADGADKTLEKFDLVRVLELPVSLKDTYNDIYSLKYSDPSSKLFILAMNLVRSGRKYNY
jgi:hypothetical protein